MQMEAEVFLRDWQGQCDSQYEAPRFSKLLCCHLSLPMAKAREFYRRCTSLHLFGKES